MPWEGGTGTATGVHMSTSKLRARATGEDTVPRGKVDGWGLFRTSTHLLSASSATCTYETLQRTC